MIFKVKKPGNLSLGKPLWLSIAGYSAGVVLLVLIGVAWYWSLLRTSRSTTVKRRDSPIEIRSGAYAERRVGGSTR